MTKQKTKITLVDESGTKLKENEKELNTSEIRYRRLFETALDGILIIDAGNEQIIDINPFLIKNAGVYEEIFYLESGKIKK